MVFISLLRESSQKGSGALWICCDRRVSASQCRGQCGGAVIAAACYCWCLAPSLVVGLRGRRRSSTWDPQLHAQRVRDTPCVCVRRAVLVGAKKREISPSLLCPLCCSSFNIWKVRYLIIVVQHRVLFDHHIGSPHPKDHTSSLPRRIWRISCRLVYCTTTQLF